MCPESQNIISKIYNILPKYMYAISPYFCSRWRNKSYLIEERRYDLNERCPSKYAYGSILHQHSDDRTPVESGTPVDKNISNLFAGPERIGP